MPVRVVPCPSASAWTGSHPAATPHGPGSRSCSGRDALLAAPPASATYAAQLVDACCYATLQPGDTLENYYSMRNTGDETWYRDGAIPVPMRTGIAPSRYQVSSPVLRIE